MIELNLIKFQRSTHMATELKLTFTLALYLVVATQQCSEQWNTQNFCIT